MSNNNVCFLFKGPTGVSGPKGARGAQGPPVSDFLEMWGNVLFCLIIAHTLSKLFLCIILGCYWFPWSCWTSWTPWS